MRDQLRDTVRKASKVVETPRRRTEEAVRKMLRTPTSTCSTPRTWRGRSSAAAAEQAEKARAALDEQIRRRLHDMGLATKDELDRLNRRISELEAAAAAGRPGGASLPTPVLPARRARPGPRQRPAPPGQSLPGRGRDR